MAFASKITAHPWHGIDPTIDQYSVSSYIEIGIEDVVKFELDKSSGLLKIDRPQRYSNFCPFLYGFIPKTYCDKEIAAYANLHSKENIEKGDGDPLDICILTSLPIRHNAFLVRAKVIGGLRLVDRGEADDKIIAVLEGDAFFQDIEELSDLNPQTLQKINHYFLTYKNMPDEPNLIVIDSVYSKDVAMEVITISQKDYRTNFE